MGTDRLIYFIFFSLNRFLRAGAVILVCAGYFCNLLTLDLLLYMNMIQHTYGIFLNGSDHVVEHLKCVHLGTQQPDLFCRMPSGRYLTEHLHVVDVIHPLAVDTFQKNYSLKPHEAARFWELSLFSLHKASQPLPSRYDMLDLIFLMTFYLSCRVRVWIGIIGVIAVLNPSRSHLKESYHQEKHISVILSHDICDHLVMASRMFSHQISQYLTTLLVDDLSLLIVNLVIVEKIFWDSGSC